MIQLLVFSYSHFIQTVVIFPTNPSKSQPYRQMVESIHCVDWRVALIFIIGAFVRNKK